MFLCGWQGYEGTSERTVSARLQGLSLGLWSVPGKQGGWIARECDGNGEKQGIKLQREWGARLSVICSPLKGLNLL